MDTITDVLRHGLLRVKQFFSRARFSSMSKGQKAPVKILNKHALPCTGFRILIIIENMSYTYDTRIQNIAKTLKEAGYQINVICPRYSGDPKKAHLDGIDVRYYYLPSCPDGFVGYLVEYTYSFTVIFILAIASHLRQRKDVLHVCNPPDFFFPLGKLFQLLNCRFVYDKHDCVPELFHERFHSKSPLIYWFLRKAEKLTERTADHIITTNESTKKSVINKNKIPEQRITVVRNGPDLDKFPSDVFANPESKTIEVGYIGNMNPQDYIEILLQSAHYIKFTKGRTDVRFILIGDGSAYEKLKELSLDLKINDIVEFTGRLSPAKAYRRLAMVHICAQPDQKNAFTDTCTMVKDLEYMALAKPIVAFDLNETRHSCGESALYATNNSHQEFAMQILKLADDSTLRVNMGELGRKRLYDQFTWSHSKNHLLKAYETVTMEPRRFFNP